MQEATPPAWAREGLDREGLDWGVGQANFNPACLGIGLPGNLIMSLTARGDPESPEDGADEAARLDRLNPRQNPSRLSK